MDLPSVARSTTVQWSCILAGAFAAWIAVFFGDVYWRADQYLVKRSDAVITAQAQLFAAATPEKRLDAINELIHQDPRGVQHVGLFAVDGHRIAGNLEQKPPDLRVGGDAQLSSIPADPSGAGRSMRGMARRLPNGDVLVVGRSVDEVDEIVGIVGEASVLGLIPAFLLSVAASVLLSVHAQERVEEVNKRVQRIVAGDLRQRLPARRVNDPIDKLAVIVNGMLDTIEALINQIAGIGDDIAHDLRTPLTRMRIGLERGRAHAQTLEELQDVHDRAIRGLDQALAIVTALLRIKEIEHSRRHAGFSNVALADIVREAAELYEPIAEEKGVALHVHVREDQFVNGDRDLLLEAVVNLVDNAVKFTPQGGRVDLALLSGDGESIIRVSDTGRGLGEHELELAVQRFYRSDRSRQTQGSGLGLSLVAAILKLHNFRLAITAGPGCVVEIGCSHTMLS